MAPLTREIDPNGPTPTLRRSISDVGVDLAPRREWQGGHMTDARNLFAALDVFDGHWQPHRVASLNDEDVKVVKVLGEFVWHSHPETDELFLVLAGELTIGLREDGVERAVVLGPHDLFVVPRGVEHRPRTAVETSALLVERRGTVNTGDAGGDLTSPLRELPDA